jgi:hypothetical protein
MWMLELSHQCDQPRRGHLTGLPHALPFPLPGSWHLPGLTTEHPPVKPQVPEMQKVCENVVGWSPTSSGPGSEAPKHTGVPCTLGEGWGSPGRALACRGQHRDFPRAPGIQIAKAPRKPQPLFSSAHLRLLSPEQGQPPPPATSLCQEGSRQGRIPVASQAHSDHQEALQACQRWTEAGCQ